MNRSGKTSLDCEALGPLLVDYADAATAEADSIRVERHLAECGACRTEFVALRRSLCVLESVWAEASRLHVRRVQPATEVSATITERRLKTSVHIPASQASLGGSEAYRSPIAAALAGVAAAVAVFAGLLWNGPWAVRGGTMAANSAGGRTDSTHAAVAEVDVHDLDIDAFIKRQEQSARLATSVQFLTSLPVEREDAERAKRYLHDAYGVKPVGLPSVDSSEL